MKQLKPFYPFATAALFLLFIILFLSVVRTSIFGYVEGEKHVFFEIVLLLLLAVLAEIIFVYLKQPSVMILLILGIVMSEHTSGFQFIKDPEVINVLAQLGAIILLFKVGLHSHLTKVFSKENIMVAAAGVIVPFLAGYFYATLNGGSFAYSMFLGAALTATSVGVTVAILKEMKLLEKKFAEVIIGAAVIDDILGLLVLSFVLNTPASISPDSLMPLVKIAGSAGVFIIGGIIAGRYFVSNILDKMELEDKTFLLAISFLLIYAYVAEYIGLSSIVGAFFAGVLLNYSRYVKEIEARTYGLEVVFTPIFFITLGMLVDIKILAAFAVPILAITLIATLSKVIACGLSSLAVGLSKIESIIIGFGMSPRGEVALIVALFGLTKGVLSTTEYSVISAMALITTVVTPPIITNLVQRLKK
ncbi:cation:proton antiporter [Candidatus Micrarchaeota archaeon]|nr:cation:proton antiporter [Candidatus Micrarchaeota archaeon]